MRPLLCLLPLVLAVDMAQAAPRISDHHLTCRLFDHPIGYLRLDLRPERDRRAPRVAYRLELSDLRDYNVIGVPARESRQWKARLAADLSLVSFECEMRSRTSADLPETRLVYRGAFDERGRGRLETSAPSHVEVDAGGPVFLLDTLALLPGAGEVVVFRPYSAALLPATVVLSSSQRLEARLPWTDSPLVVERDAEGIPRRITLSEDLFQYEWQAEGKSAATARRSPLDAPDQAAVLDRMAVGGIATEPEIAEPERVRYLRAILHLPAAPAVLGLDLPEETRELDGNRLELTLSARRLAPAEGDLSPWLAPDLFANSEHPRVRTALREALRPEEGDVEKAARLTHYVHQKVRFQLSPGLPVASESLACGAGDCTEHSTVYAALARAAGLPCKVVGGLAYRDGRFRYHAWNEVAVQTSQGRFWLPQDPSFGLSQVDATHIKLVEGNVDRQAVLGRLIGRIRLDILEAR